MARLTGPDESVRLVYLASGSNSGKAAAQGLSVPLYADAALTTAADVRTVGGAVIAGSPPTLTVDAYSRIPLFLFPDGVDTVYTSINGGPSVALYARTDDRLDTLATGLVTVSAEATTKANAAEAAARYVPAAVIANMTTPMRTAHRTGGSTNAFVVGPYPENTIEGGRGIIAAATTAGISNFVLNCQFQPSADGTVVAHHDTSVDRTTTGTGNLADMGYGAIKSLSIDADTYTGSTVWGNALKVPTVDDILDAFGGKVALNLAAYGASSTGIGQSIVSKVLARGLGPTVIVGSFNTLNLTPARDAGIATIYYPPDEGQAGATAAEVAAVNVWATGLPKYVGVSIASTDAYISSLIAAGLHVSVYFTTRRYDRDRLLALGVQGIISDDPIYQHTSGRLWTSTTDPYTTGAWPHGALESDANLGRGSLSANGLKSTSQANQQAFVQGSRCPIASPAGTYTFTGSVTFDAITADLTRSAQIFICAPDDRKTSGTPSTNSGVVDGYVVLLRANGNMELFRNTFGTQANIKVGSTGASATITQGTTVPFTLQVTPTTITLTRTDTAATIAWTDSTYRGAYYHVGKSTNISVSWKITSVS